MANPVTAHNLSTRGCYSETGRLHNVADFPRYFPVAPLFERELAFEAELFGRLRTTGPGICFSDPKNKPTPTMQCAAKQAGNTDCRCRKRLLQCAVGKRLLR